MQEKARKLEVIHYKKKLTTPGFIDTHLHATQSAIVAAYGDKLEWLNNYVFPAEIAYKDEKNARKDLNFFLNHLIRNGTTTAVAYGPLYLNAADIFFEEINNRNMRFIAGNVLMDKNAPGSLKLSAQENYDNSKKLIAMFQALLWLQG